MATKPCWPTALGDATSVVCLQVNMSLEEHDTGHGKEMYQPVDSCWALGDCSANMELPLPALAQVRCSSLPHPPHAFCPCASQLACKQRTLGTSE